MLPKRRCLGIGEYGRECLWRRLSNWLFEIARERCMGSVADSETGGGGHTDQTWEEESILSRLCHRCMFTPT